MIGTLEMMVNCEKTWAAHMNGCRGQVYNALSEAGMVSEYEGWWGL